MNQLRNLVIEQYAEHYSRINSVTNPTQIPSSTLNSMQLIYGDLIAPLSVGSKVLDLGCGTGFLLYWLSLQPGIIPVGIDSSRTQVEVARQSLPDIEINYGDGLDYLQNHSNEFSGIFCTDVLEHIPGQDLCLKWVQTVQIALQPGGFFFCRVPNAANLTGSYSRYMDLTHERSFTSSSLLQFLEVTGLQNCQIKPIRAAHLSGRIRLVVEQLLHKSIFLICGRGKEQVFTSNVCAVGFKR